MRSSLSVSASLRRVVDSLAASRAADPSIAPPLRAEGGRLLMELRQIETQIASQATASLRELEAAKARVDEADGEHRSLKYQKSHSLAAIAKAKEGEGGGAECLVQGENHKERLAGLAAECRARRELCEAVGQARDCKRARHGEVESQKKLLAEVDVQMASVLSAATPLQASLPPLQKMGLGEEAGKLTQILPAPLFTLWHAISAYIGAWDAKATIHVVGDEAEAMRVNASASEGSEGWGGMELRPYPLSLDLSLRAGEVVFSFTYYAQLRMLAVAAKVCTRLFGGRRKSAQGDEVGRGTAQLGGRKREVWPMEGRGRGVGTGREGGTEKAEAWEGSRIVMMGRVCSEYTFIVGCDLPLYVQTFPPLPSPPSQPDPASKALSSLFPGDDGTKLPDQRCLLRALSLKPAGGVGVEGDCLHSILPARPYMWAQWMGGLGPVLNRGGGRSSPPTFQVWSLTHWVGEG